MGTNYYPTSEESSVMALSNHLLKNRVVVVTHPIKKDDELVHNLKKHKIDVVNLPLIVTEAIPFQLSNPLYYYDWIVFTSKNALKPFFSSVKLDSIKIATIGEATHLQLQKIGYNSDFVGSGRSGKDFADELKTVVQPSEKLLLVLGNLASDVVENSLSEKYNVDRVNVYNTLKTTNIDSKGLQLIQSNGYDLITVTSPSAVHHLLSLVPFKKQKLRLASIGIVTTAAIEEYGYSPVAEADFQSYSGLAEVVIEWLKHNRQTDL